MLLPFVFDDFDWNVYRKSILVKVSQRFSAFMPFYLS